MLQQYAEQKEGVISCKFNEGMEFGSRIPIILSIFSAKKGISSIYELFNGNRKTLGCT